MKTFYRARINVLKLHVICVCIWLIRYVIASSIDEICSVEMWKAKLLQAFLFGQVFLSRTNLHHSISFLTLSSHFHSLSLPSHSLSLSLTFILSTYTLSLSLFLPSLITLSLLRLRYFWPSFSLPHTCVKIDYGKKVFKAANLFLIQFRGFSNEWPGFCSNMTFKNSRMHENVVAIFFHTLVSLQKRALSFFEQICLQVAVNIAAVVLTAISFLVIPGNEYFNRFKFSLKINLCLKKKLIWILNWILNFFWLESVRTHVRALLDDSSIIFLTFVLITSSANELDYISISEVPLSIFFEGIAHCFFVFCFLLIQLLYCSGKYQQEGFRR